jgi:hypothetical protein
VRITVTIEGELAGMMAREVRAAERAVTLGIRASAAALQGHWRWQIEGAKLGPRLRNTIRRKTYPATGFSIGAAALVYSKAAKIVDAFDRGVLIRSRDGFFLAIPLAAAGLGPGGRRITPGAWERRTGKRLRFVYRRRGPSLLVADDARLTARGLAANKGGRRRADGSLTGAQTVPVFLLVPQVKLAKRLDLAGAAAEAGARLPGAILARWTDA